MQRKLRTIRLKHCPGLSRHSNAFPQLFYFSSVLPRFSEDVEASGHCSLCCACSSLFVEEFVVCSFGVITPFIGVFKEDVSDPMRDNISKAPRLTGNDGFMWASKQESRN